MMILFVIHFHVGGRLLTETDTTRGNIDTIVVIYCGRANMFVLGNAFVRFYAKSDQHHGLLIDPRHARYPPHIQISQVLDECWRA